MSGQARMAVGHEPLNRGQGVGPPTPEDLDAKRKEPVGTRSVSLGVIHHAASAQSLLHSPVVNCEAAQASSARAGDRAPAEAIAEERQPAKHPPNHEVESPGVCRRHRDTDSEHTIHIAPECMASNLNAGHSRGR